MNDFVIKKGNSSNIFILRGDNLYTYGRINKSKSNRMKKGSIQVKSSTKIHIEISIKLSLDETIWNCYKKCIEKGYRKKTIIFNVILFKINILIYAYYSVNNMYVICNFKAVKVKRKSFDTCSWSRGDLGTIKFNGESGTSRAGCRRTHEPGWSWNKVPISRETLRYV